MTRCGPVCPLCRGPGRPVPPLGWILARCVPGALPAVDPVGRSRRLRRSWHDAARVIPLCRACRHAASGYATLAHGGAPARQDQHTSAASRACFVGRSPCHGPCAPSYHRPGCDPLSGERKPGFVTPLGRRKPGWPRQGTTRTSPKTSEPPTHSGCAWKDPPPGSWNRHAHAPCLGETGAAPSRVAQTVRGTARRGPVPPLK